MRTLLTAGTASLTLAASLAVATAAPVTFNNAGSTFQSFTAPSAGTYDIVAFGAQGGSVTDIITGAKNSGGLGAEIGGNFVLTAGETLSIAVGTMGSPGGGGGGGTFVVGPGNSPLVIAGGGGGASTPLFADSSIAGQTGTAGCNAYASSSISTCGHVGVGGSNIGLGGIDGNGGSGGGNSAGGGGFYSAGGTSFYGAAGGAGYPSLLGGNGVSPTFPPGIGAGGFGGGGGGFGSGAVNGGGGGGYSGGGGALGSGGGGGSFDAGTNQVLVAGFNSGDGSVVITELSATPVPEPANLALLGVGIAGLLSVRRRRPG